MRVVDALRRADAFEDAGAHRRRRSPAANPPEAVAQVLALERA